MKKKQKFSNYELLFTSYHLPEAGFTLMELMVVIAIIVLLAGIMTPNVARRLERAKMTRAEADIAAIENAIAMYENDTGRYPEDNNPAASPAWESIDVLAWRLTAREPDGTPEPLISNDRNWHGPYIKGIDEDSWKEYYVYTRSTPTAGDGGCIEPPGNLSYYIYSTGKDKKTSTGGDGHDYENPKDTTKNHHDDDVNNWDVKKSWREEY